MEHAHRHGPGISPAFLVGILLVSVLAAVLGRLFTHGRDRGRIERFVAEQGSQLVSCRPEPFGPGWPGGVHSRVYAIEIRDAAGHVRAAQAKTSTFGGIQIVDGVAQG